MTATPMEADPGRDVLSGVGLMLGFCVTAPLIDVASKLAAETMSVGAVTAARFVVQGAVMLPFAWGGLALPRALVGPLVLRAACLVVSTFAFVSAIAVMPLADALAIVFVMPLVLLLLGHLLDGDEVGPRRILACLVGFGGSLLVIQPSFALFGAVALWPLLTAATFALYMLMTRRVSGRMGLAAMQVHTSWIAMAMCLPVLALGHGAGWAAFEVARPEGWAWAWLAGVGLASAVAHGLMSQALRRAPSATLAPLEYLEIVSAVALSWWVFGDWPDRLTWVGIGVIVASGMAVIHLERRASAARRAAPPPRPGATPAAG